ncbi:dihydrofolate reductase-like [Nymphaea colorata]|nr:dihydrofolate reductase-like [Nymphaea colorata]
MDVGRQEEQVVVEKKGKKKPRVLCLHGFRTSGAIMNKQIHKWPDSLVDKFDLVFLDAPFPAEGKSDVEHIFPPPYYEWFQFNEKFTEYRNFDECLAYIEDFMVENGPFDGFMGFSQGAILSAALPGLQAKGYCLKKVPKIQFVVIISGAKFAKADVAELAYSTKIDRPSIHFLGETDFLRPHGEVLLECYENPKIIRHPVGHTVPRLDEKAQKVMLDFIESI